MALSLSLSQVKRKAGLGVAVAPPSLSLSLSLSPSREAIGKPRRSPSILHVDVIVAFLDVLFDQAEGFASTLVGIPSPHDDGGAVAVMTPRIGRPAVGIRVAEGGSCKLPLDQVPASSHLVVGGRYIPNTVFDSAMSIRHGIQQLCGPLNMLI